uniref:Uncharacterized protein n=1 Tax=Oryza brachyantha TaxID=4533 RepID=J3MZJ7_ORYBR
SVHAVRHRRNESHPPLNAANPSNYYRPGHARRAGSRGAVDARLGDAGAGVDEVAVDEVGGEDLELVAEALGEDLGDEEAGVAVDPAGDRLDAEHRVVGLRRHRVLHPVVPPPEEDPPVGHRRLLAEELDVALELGLRQVGVDPVVLEVAGAPQRLAGLGRRRLARLPHADEPPREQLGDGLVEHRLVLRDQVLAELLHQVLVELRRVLVAELGAHLEDHHLRLRLAEEPLHVGEHDVDGVGGEHAVADAALLLDPHVDDARPRGELLVHRQRLALRERPRHERDADLVRRRVVRPGPHHLVHPHLLRPELRHPLLPVGRPVLAARERLAAGRQPRRQRLLLAGHELPAVHLRREEGAHGVQRVAAFLAGVVAIGGRRHDRSNPINKPRILIRLALTWRSL